MSTPPARSDSGSAPVLAIDPGKDKCGIAVVAADGEVLVRRIVPPDGIESVLESLQKKYGLSQFIIGDATTSRALREKLSTRFPGVAIVAVAERNSTLEARTLYWQANPPRGWRKLWPLSLQTPPVPIDDFAAVVLAHRFRELQHRSS